ncbi:M28 family peptidase [uncultured Paludibaculum sp.]|uniref:M28 family peptidase n=1 Tax=uncultured Paludibaculum sp. TaxID=1765020 RepID=UPI002AABDA1D|nr:M28 family peptidase [uncultured Paludibaculum sp.]
MRYLFVLALTASLFAAQPLSPAEEALLSPITANVLKGHISFLASDALDGRDTPSKGLDVAAEYIAAQFRRYGLEPAGDNGYFQSAAYVNVTQPAEGLEITLTSGGKTWKADKEHVMISSSGTAQIHAAGVVKVTITDENTPLPDRTAVEGKAVILIAPMPRSRAMLRKRESVLDLGPAIVVTGGFTGFGRTRLREAGETTAQRPPMITTSDPEFNTFVESLDAAATLEAAVPAPVLQPVTLKNIIATLPGSDPALKDTYILLTAHYDHIGISTRGEGDRLNNGANDDASGVATVLALAESFSKSTARPKRTLVFMTYFGEEKGLFGSRYYGSHPVFPLAKTIANLNFEHMGRTDDNEGDRSGKITASGFDYTTLGDALTEAGKATGIEAWKHAENSDAFFGRSDNQSLADSGVPAITVAVSWIFPDYHRPGDEWEKINYPNMEKEVRTCALAVERIANDSRPVKWNETNPKAEKYVEAWRKLHSAN